MKTNGRFGKLVAAIAVVMSGCASHRAGDAGVETAASDQAARQAAPAAAMPDLKIILDCGTCAVKPEIPQLIVQTYHDAARQAGREISTTRHASLTITEYSTRYSMTGYLTGAYFGRDQIKAALSYQGRSWAFEDYYRNAWHSIEGLARKIGTMSFAELK